MKWNDVKETPPPKDKSFIAYGDGKQHVVYHQKFSDEFFKDDEGYFTGSGTTCYYCGGVPTCSMSKAESWEKGNWVFTHWMERPKDPE